MKNGWVLDCSMALAFGLPDEQSDIAVAFGTQIKYETPIWVPPLWWYEISNGIVTAQKRGRLTEAEGIFLMESYRKLQIKTDINVGDNTFVGYSKLSTTNSLSAYDASYLEIAMRRGTGLATLDKKLASVASKLGITVWSSKK